MVLAVRPRWFQVSRSDATLTALLAIPVIGGTLVMTAVGIYRPAVLLLALAAVGTLLLRSSHPVLAALLALGLAAALPSDGALLLPPLIILYGIAARQTVAPGVLIVVALAGAASLAWLSFGHVTSSRGVVAEVCTLAAFSAAAVTLGVLRGARASMREASRERAERLARERELLTEHAVASERLRIAQELHDVVAHNVSLMVVQAQALGATHDEEPVTIATDAIADLGRQAMAEMHQTLKLLRTDDPAGASRIPQPGLKDLDRLLNQARAAGLPIELVVEGDPRPLSRAAELSAFRIVQEALTNVRKHASSAPTTITLSYRAERFDVTVVDRGPQTPPATDAAEQISPGAVGGHGLTGMRERAALFGGTLIAQPRAGGFEVHAILPYRPPTS